MTTAVAAIVLALWLLGGHLRDGRLGRAVRLWMGPCVALALVTDRGVVAGVAVLGFCLLTATLIACARWGNANVPTEMRSLLDLAEREAKTRYARELRSLSGPVALPSDDERTAHG